MTISLFSKVVYIVMKRKEVLLLHSDWAATDPLSDSVLLRELAIEWKASCLAIRLSESISYVG